MTQFWKEKKQMGGACTYRPYNASTQVGVEIDDMALDSNARKGRRGAQWDVAPSRCLRPNLSRQSD